MGKIERTDNTKCFHLFGELEHPYIGAEVQMAQRFGTLAISS